MYKPQHPSCLHVSATAAHVETNTAEPATREKRWSRQAEGGDLAAKAMIRGERLPGWELHMK